MPTFPNNLSVVRFMEQHWHRSLKRLLVCTAIQRKEQRWLFLSRHLEWKCIDWKKLSPDNFQRLCDNYEEEGGLSFRGESRQVKCRNSHLLFCNDCKYLRAYISLFQNKLCCTSCRLHGGAKYCSFYDEERILYVSEAEPSLILVLNKSPRPILWISAQSQMICST